MQHPDSYQISGISPPLINMFTPASVVVRFSAVVEGFASQKCAKESQESRLLCRNVVIMSLPRHTNLHGRNRKRYIFALKREPTFEDMCGTIEREYVFFAAWAGKTHPGDALLQHPLYLALRMQGTECLKEKKKKRNKLSCLAVADKHPSLHSVCVFFAVNHRRPRKSTEQGELLYGRRKPTCACANACTPLYHNT